MKENGQSAMWVCGGCVGEGDVVLWVGEGDMGLWVGEGDVGLWWRTRLVREEWRKNGERARDD